MTHGTPQRTRSAKLTRLAGRITMAVVFAPVFLWCVGAIWFCGIGPPAVGGLAAIAFGIIVPILWFRRRSRGFVAVAFWPAAVGIVLLWQLKTPTNDRVWAPDMAELPYAEFFGDIVTMHNVRNCTYRSVEDFDVAWETRTYNLARLRSVDFMVEEIWEWHEGSAHTLLTFGFDDGRYVAISVELRREAGERFHPVSGMFRQFELMYVVGDERDLIRLRTNERGDTVYLYPMRTTPASRRALLVDMLHAMNRLREQPRFYHTFRSSCTTVLVDHVNRIAPRTVPRSYEVFLPGYSGGLAWELGLVDTELPYEQARERFRIDEKARAVGDGADFSMRIREQISSASTLPAAPAPPATPRP